MLLHSSPTFTEISPSQHFYLATKISLLVIFFSLPFFRAIPAHAIAVSDGLISYWRLDDASGTTATDESGNGNTVTLVNGPLWTTGKFGGGLGFDGVNDVVQKTPTSFDFTGDLTVSLWFNQSPLAGNSTSAALIGAADGTVQKFFIYLDRKNRRVCAASAGGPSCTAFDTYTTVGTWTHLVLVRPASGQSTTVYLNNVLKGTFSTGTPVAARSLTLGQFAFPVANFGGQIDDVGIYNRKLSTAEIQSLFDVTSSPPPPPPPPSLPPPPSSSSLIGQWKFDEASGTTAADTSGNGNTLTLANGPTWAAGKFGGAISFDGVNDVVQRTPVSFNFTGDLTVSLWFNQSLTTGHPTSAALIGGANATVQKFFVYLDRKNKRICVASAGGADCTAFNTYTTAGNWTHLAVVRPADGQNISVYLNNSLKGTLSTGIPVTANTLTIGRYALDVVQFGGSIDEVTIYNRKLSSAEIQSLFDPDLIVPTRSAGMPSGVLPAETTQITLSLSTNEKATCKYSSTAETAYSAMTASFATTGDTLHSTTLTGLQSGQSYTYQVRCQDLAGNTNNEDFPISFSIAVPLPPPDTTPPTLSDITVSNLTLTSASVHWVTDEAANSQIEYGPTQNYGITTTLDPTLVTSHTQTLSSLMTNTTYHYRVKSKDTAGNEVVSSNQTFTTPCDLGISDAPCKPANARIVIVAQDGSGDYLDLEPALEAALPGDTIQIKNGTYNCLPNCSGEGGYFLQRSGTRALPIAIVNFPGHRPHITTTITSWGQWVLIEGLEISQIRGDGIRLYYNPLHSQFARHITIRNNWIHENGYQGLYGGGLSDLLIEQNVFERNGLGPGDCTGDWGDETHTTYLRYVHCHGIYLSNSIGTTSNSDPTTRVTIRRNQFLGNAGFGWTNRSDGVRSTHYLVENNLLVNNSLNHGFIDLDQSIIRNNTVAQFAYAQPNAASKTCFYSNHNTQNTIANNVCYAVLVPTLDSLYPIHSWAVDSTVGNTWVRNAFFITPGTNWIWGGTLIRDFLNSYQSTAGDTNGLTIPLVSGDGSEAGFVDAVGGNFHLTSSSPLVGAGDPAQCPTVDLEGTPRSSATCTIGAYTAP